MTAKAALQHAGTALQQAGFASPVLDAEVLLGHVLDVSRGRLMSHPEQKLTTEQRQRFFALLERRLLHEPVAYLIGTKDFYGRTFAVTRDVLIPRPESELLIETCLNIFTRSGTHFFADIGTGSGCLAVTLALEFPNARILATDVSEPAFNVAQKNAERHDVRNRVTFLEGSLLEPIKGQKVDAIVANLPYVPNEERLRNPDLAYEPVLALSGTKEPEQLYAEFFDQWNARPNRPVTLLEIHPNLREFLERETARRGIAATFKSDLTGRDRVAMLQSNIHKEHLVCRGGTDWGFGGMHV